MVEQKIGIAENLFQFSLLVVINLFVGSMAGIERTVLPLLGEKPFGLASTSAALSFIIGFGFSKALDSAENESALVYLIDSRGSIRKK